MASKATEGKWGIALVECDVCGHEWVAVAHVPAFHEGLECPECGHIAGRIPIDDPA